MAETMSQQGFGLSVPSSRQDVISALLNDYGNSFGRGDASSSAYSPVPSEKELPPPPPRSDSLDKPLPAVQRAEQRMSMKFQLRGRRILFLLYTGGLRRLAHVELSVETWMWSDHIHRQSVASHFHCISFGHISVQRLPSAHSLTSCSSHLSLH